MKNLLRPIGGVLALTAVLFAVSRITSGAGAAHINSSADNGNLLLGNPSGATLGSSNNRLLERPEYSLSYNKANGGPNWVSWHLCQADRGSAGRGNDFAPDPALPAGFRIRPADYRGSGYDRGHQCPSGDRTSTAQANSHTFLMSNMLPQAPDLNRELWRKFEEYCRSQLRGGRNELYIVCGGVGSLGRIGDGKVNVPASCWKVAVILPEGDNDLSRITASTRVVAVLMPNRNGADIAEGDWRDYRTSVDEIQRQTGYDLLSNVPAAVQNVIESRVDTGRASSRAPRRPRRYD